MKLFFYNHLVLWIVIGNKIMRLLYESEYHRKNWSVRALEKTDLQSIL
jgi:predicted nuclease of restriction endonuclease-like (RecB) superfamily